MHRYAQWGAPPPPLTLPHDVSPLSLRCPRCPCSIESVSALARGGAITGQAHGVRAVGIRLPYIASWRAILQATPSTVTRPRGRVTPPSAGDGRPWCSGRGFSCKPPAALRSPLRTLTEQGLQCAVGPRPTRGETRAVISSSVGDAESLLGWRAGRSQTRPSFRGPRREASGGNARGSCRMTPVDGMPGLIRGECGCDERGGAPAPQLGLASPPPIRALLRGERYAPAATRLVVGTGRGQRHYPGRAGPPPPCREAPALVRGSRHMDGASWPGDWEEAPTLGLKPLQCRPESMQSRHRARHRPPPLSVGTRPNRRYTAKSSAPRETAEVQVRVTGSTVPSTTLTGPVGAIPAMCAVPGLTACPRGR